MNRPTTPVRAASITERPNALTRDIDLADALGIVRLLRACDGQIFAGYDTHAGLPDAEVLQSILEAAREAAEVLAKPNGRVIMSGAGTSGRLAMFAARALNRAFSDTKYRYTMAGGIEALIKAQEGAEDDPVQGEKDLVAAAEGAEAVFYVGITCGLSAPYVAGQLAAMLDSKVSGHAVLLGFNPLELARDAAIEGWPHTFREIAERAAQSAGATLITPVVGAEPITGSTRMKCGSATKIVLEMIFMLARRLSEGGGIVSDDVATEILRDYLRVYAQAAMNAYASAGKLAELVNLGAQALRSGGHIYYIGEASDGIAAGDDVPGGLEAGILGLIDASECPPTYGASFEDVRGFLTGGWAALLPGAATDLSDRGATFRVAIEDFRKDKLPSLEKNDLVVALGNFEGVEALLKQSASVGASTAWVGFSDTGFHASTHVEVLLPSADRSSASSEDRVPGILRGGDQLTVKLVLNALTTGAHVLAGKVYGNRMIDLRISNNKLYHRSVGIIADLMRVEREAGEEALLRAVYQTDKVGEVQRDRAVRDHIETAKSVEKVVPKALLMATGRFTYAAATKALATNPVVRQVIGQYVMLQ